MTQLVLAPVFLHWGFYFCQKKGTVKCRTLSPAPCQLELTSNLILSSALGWYSKVKFPFLYLTMPKEPIEQFEIFIDREGKEYKMTVYLTEQSSQVMRFIVKGGQRAIALEKRLAKEHKRQPWRITGGSADFTTKEAKAAMVKIWKAIDFHYYWETKGKFIDRSDPKNLEDKDRDPDRRM